MLRTAWTLCTGCSTHQLLTVSAAERLLIVLNVHSQRTLGETDLLLRKLFDLDMFYLSWAHFKGLRDPDRL